MPLWYFIPAVKASRCRDSGLKNGNGLECNNKIKAFLVAVMHFRSLSKNQVTMQNLTRRKMMTLAATLAVLTIALVILAKIIGAIVVAAFFAGVGVSLTLVVWILANLLAKPTDRKK